MTVGVELGELVFVSVAVRVTVGEAVDVAVAVAEGLWVDVIVSVEEIVDSEVLREHSEKTILPGFMVDAVVEVPRGAHPTSFFPDYGYDSDFHAAWASISRDDDAVKAFIERYVMQPATQQEYLDAIDGKGILSDELLEAPAQ